MKKMRLSSNCSPLSQSAPGVLFSRERTPLPWGAARAESGRQRRAIAGGIAGFCRSVTPRWVALLPSIHRPHSRWRRGRSGHLTGPHLSLLPRQPEHKSRTLSLTPGDAGKWPPVCPGGKRTGSRLRLAGLLTRSPLPASSPGPGPQAVLPCPSVQHGFLGTGPCELKRDPTPLPRPCW